MKKICLLFFIFFLAEMGNVYSAEKIYLKNVVFLKGPVEKLILEFDKRPEYKVVKKDNKLIFNFFDTIPQNSSWIKSLPKDIFKEIKVSFEKNKLILEFVINKNFNFQIIPFDNKIINEFIWKSSKKPVNITIKGQKVEPLKESISEMPFIKEKEIKYPKYEIYLENNKKIELPMTKEKYHGIPITVDFQNADIHAVLRLLAEIGDINIIVSDHVKGTVTLRAKNVPWDLLFDAVLANKGLAKLKVGNIVRIGTLDEIKKQADLYRSYMESLAQSKESIRTEIEAQRDIYRSLKEMQEEQNILITKAYKLKYLRIGKNYLGGPFGQSEGQDSLLVTHLKDLVKGDNKITFDPFTNTIIVKATPKVLKEVERIIKELDKPRPQILIEARIVEISNTYVHNLGIRWGGAAWKATEHSIWGISPNPTSNTGNISYTYPGGGYTSGGNNTISLPSPTIVDLGVQGATSQLGIVLGHFGKTAEVLDMQLSALEENGVGRIISKPKVLTLDQEPAIIQQGYKIPYLQWQPNVTQATTAFIDAGLKLQVVPSITPEGKLLLDIYLERSYPDWSHTINGVPTLITDTIQTSALVNNAETLVLGGIKISNIYESINKVPGMSNIPGLGEIFKRKGKSLEDTELMIFITPKIVYYPIKGIDY